MDIIITAKDLANNSDCRYTTTAGSNSSNNKSNILHAATASPVLGDTAKTPLVRPGHVVIVSRPPSVSAITARPPSVQQVTAAVVKRVDGLTPLVTAGHVITVPSGEARMSVLKPHDAR
jgi:hypothetical protein